MPSPRLAGDIENPYGENRIFFHLTGPAQLKALDNGKPNDIEPFYGTSERSGFFGLARAYVEASNKAGDIVMTAGAILGDKKLAVSNKVHIDARQIALRGNPANNKLEIFYTTDGSTPSMKSARYQAGFSIALGTTVKALVIADGKPVLTMKERFAADVGLLWEGGGQVIPRGTGSSLGNLPPGLMDADGICARNADRNRRWSVAKIT